MKKEKAVCVYLGEIHAQSHLRQQMHDDTFVFFNRFTFAVIISLIMTVKLIWEKYTATNKLGKQQM